MSERLPDDLRARYPDEAEALDSPGPYSPEASDGRTDWPAKLFGAALVLVALSIIGLLIWWWL